MSSANAWNLDQSKILSCGKELNKNFEEEGLKSLMDQGEIAWNPWFYGAK